MPKSKFDAFYYGIGMKLDEASVDQAGKQLEGKLNKVVDRVKENLVSISEAADKGVKNINTKGLVSALVAAQKELGRFDDFDPKKLKGQIDGLENDFKGLQATLGDVADSLKGFKDLGGFITDISTRLGNIEIKTTKQGKDAFKADLKEMKTLAQGFSNILAGGEKVDTSALDRYFQKVKAGFASLKASGNPMELFADKELANYFVDLTNILRKMGAPVEDLRADFFELSSTFKNIFEGSNTAGAQTVFKNTGYQIEAVSAKLRTAQAELARYEAEINRLQSRSKSTGFDITVEDDKNLGFEAKIARIQQYGDIIAELDYGEEWAAATKNQIALIQSAEKELKSLLKKPGGAESLKLWKDLFGFDLTDKLSTDVISDYVKVTQTQLEELKASREKIKAEIAGYQSDIGRLQATEKVVSPKKTKQTSKSTTQKQKADGVVAEVQAKIKINEAEWTKTINAALVNIESKNKVKPFKIKVEATQGKILEEIKKIKEATLMDKKNNGDKDVVSFNNNFDKFINNLKTRKQELIDELKQNWHPALKQAFSFRMELLGIDNKSMTENIATHMLSTVDAINTVIEGKPIILHSNIDTLVEEIKTKLQDIKVDIGAGNVNINPQGLSNANIIINGIVGQGITLPSVSPAVTQPTSIPVVQPQPSTPIETPTTTSSGGTDLQAIYNNAAKTIKDWLDGFTDPVKALELVKKQAQVLYQRLQDAGEGTQEYYEAQIQLTTLLSKWRYKIGGAKADKAFKVPGIMGKGAQPAKNWNKYLIDNGIIPDPKNSNIISSVGKLEELYGLKKPSGTSSSSKSSKSTANAVQEAEQQMTNQLEAGRKIVENYIKLAKWAKALGPIAEGVDIEIKESDFKDKDTINRRGNFYTKEDIGTVIPGRKISFEELDAFIAEYEQSENEEDRQLFNFLKNLIDAYKGNQQRLDSLLNELSDSDVVGRYEFSDNKKETLATDTQSAYKTIMSKKGSKKAQQHLTDVFGKYNIDLSALPSAKTYAEQWQIIEQQIIGRKGLDFEGLMSELGSLKGNVGKTYENFMTLLKVSKAYMLASNSLGEVGQEASILMRGKKEKVDREIREYDPSIGRTRGTGKYIEGGKNSIVIEGFRQELSRLAVVFIDELGNAIYGFGTGQNVVGKENYMSGSSESYSKIITFLSNALNQAAEIAIDTRKRGMKGYENVTRWDAEEYTQRQNRPIGEYTDWTTSSTEKSTIKGYIEGTQKVIDSKQKLKDKLLAENKQVQETITALENKNNRTKEENQKLESLKTTLENNKKAISEYTAEIQKQKARLPELQEKLKAADNKNITYSKSYERAASALPVVSDELKARQAHYGTESKAYTMMREVGLVKAKASSQSEYDALLKVALPLEELNKKLLSGKMTEKEYVDQIAKAHITILGMSKEEAEAEARALKDQVLRIQKLQEEKKILEEIIRIKKPKEQDIIKPTTQGGGKSQPKPQESQKPALQPTSGGVQPTNSGTYSTIDGQGVVLNLGATGLAKDTTVRAIYDLLSVKKNGNVDSRIEEVKKAITAKEEEKHAREEAEKAQKVEAIRKQAEEEAARKAAETKKAEQDARRAAEAEATKKKAEEDAAKAKAEAEKKKAEELRKEAEQKAAEVARREADVKAKESAQKHTPTSTSKQTENTEQSFFASAKKTYQETADGNKVFREQRILSDNGTIVKEMTGLIASIVGRVPNKFESHGHAHPDNDLYSGQDIKTMAQIRGFNSSYNTDWLMTRDYVYKLSGLANVSSEQLQHIAKIFEDLESSQVNNVLSNKVKESELYHFAKDNGLNYSKNTYDELGNLTNVIDQETFISKDALNMIKEFIKISKDIKVTTGNERAELLSKRQSLRDSLKKDAVVGPLMLADAQKETDETKYNVAMNRKMRSGTLIQEAIDFDFDLSLFINQFKDFFSAMDALGEQIKPNSSLAQIKAYVEELGTLDKSDTKYQDIIKKIQGLAQSTFGRSNSSHIDERYIDELKDIASRDKTGKIKSTIRQVQADGLLQKTIRQDGVENTNINDMASANIDDEIRGLKTELARLETLRDSGEVDPRFATAEKQDIIIGLLKNGIKVSGKAEGKAESGEDNKEKKPRVPQMPNVTKASILDGQISGLTNINKNSSLYTQYIDAKERLDEAISSTIAKGNNRTKDDTDQIRTLLNDVTRLGKQIIKTSEAFDQFQSKGGKSFRGVIMDVDTLEQRMRELAAANASESHQLIRDVSYNDVSQKMTYNLVDLEGNITRVTMAYNELLGSILTTSEQAKTSASKIYGIIEGEMTNRIGVKDVVDSNPMFTSSKEYKSYIDAYNAMMEAQDALRVKGEMATTEERNNLISLTNEVANTRSEFEKLVKASAEFNAKVGNNFEQLDSNFDMSDLSSKMKEFVLNSGNWTQSQRKMIEETWTFKDAQKEASYSVVDGNKQLVTTAVIADEGTRRIGQYTVETKKYTSEFGKFMTSLKGKWKEVARYLMSFGSLYRVWAILRQGITYIKEIDTALTELKKVTNETEETYDRFLNTAAKTASKVGSTIKEIVNSTADWARIGYNLQEAATLAESTAILLNVSEFQSIDEATSALTSTLQAFGYTANQSMEVVDVLNEVGNNFAISSDGIATALQDSASSLMAANNSYEQAVALIAAANRVVQDPNSVGAALRTISLRLRGTSVKELEESGEDTTGVVESTSKLRSKVKSLSGVDILTDTGAYKDTYTILLEISKVWEDISDIDQAALLELLAGKTRSNTLAAILSNQKDLEAAYESAMKADGSALRENEKYLESIQGHIDLFNNAVQTMWNNGIDSEWVKGFVDLGRILVELIDKFGLIKSLIMGIGTYLIQKHFKGDLFGGLFGGEETIDDMKARLKSLKSEYEKAQNAYDNNHTRANKKYRDKTQKQYEKYESKVGPKIKEYDDLENKLSSLKEKRQSLMNEISDGQKHEDFLGSRMAAGYEDAAGAIDKVHAKNEQLKGQLNQVDQEIINVETELKNVKNQANQAGNAGMTFGQKFKAGAQTAWTSIKKLGKQIVQSMATAYVITTVLDLITQLGHAIEDWVDSWVETPEEAQEEFEKLNEELSSIQSEIGSLNSELEATQERIDELMSQGTLSFTEQEELDKLRAENNELERKIKLNKALEESKQKSVNSAAVNATDKYMSGTSFGSDKSKSERQEEAKETGSTIGKIAGGIIGAILIGLGVLGEGVSFGTSTGLIVLGGSMMAGGAIGGAVGSGVAGAAYDSEQSVAEAMDNMIAQREKLKKAQDDALVDGDTEAYNEATQALAAYDEQMSKHITQIQANYNAMDWSTATEQERKKMQEYADWLDRYSISMGASGAKTSAIERIFGGEEASQELKNIDKQIKKTIKSGGTIDFYEMFNSAGLADTKQRLAELGISITDLKYYYLDWKKAEEEVEGNTYESVKAVSSLTDGIDALKDAFSEYQEEGLVTADTLVDLYDTFGSLGDEWNNYVDIMATGTASTQEAKKATEDLLEAFMNQRLDQGPIKDMKEYLALIAQLQHFGVSNAKGYADALQKSSMISSISKDVVNQEKELAELEEKKKNGEITNEEYNEKKANLQKTKEDFIKQYEEEYNIELSDEEEKLLIEKAITAEKTKQNAAEAQIKANERQEALQRKENLEEDIADKENSKKQALTEAEQYREVAQRHKDAASKSVNSADQIAHHNEAARLERLAIQKEQEAEALQGEIDNLNNEMNGIEIPAEVNVDAAEQQAEDAQEAYQQALDDSGLKIQIELYEAGQAIDDIQAIYDTLANAQKEYNENGYFSVDTMQTLLELEPKYLALLYDENGNLNLNKQALLNVAKARIIDLGIKQKTSLVNTALSLSETGTTEALMEHINVTEAAIEANDDYITSTLKTIKANLERRKSEGSIDIDVDAFMSGLNSQLDAIDRTTNIAIKNIGSAISSAGSGASKTALEKIQEKYEHQIKNLENQQTYIENEIEKLEAQDEGVSADYYEKQIDLEEEKIALYQQEREELLKLERTDEVAEAIWEVEHAIQESTLSIIEFRKSIAELYETASKGITDAYGREEQLIDDRSSFIENEISIRETKGELIPTSAYDDLIAEEQDRRANAEAELNAQADLYWQGVGDYNKKLEATDPLKKFGEGGNVDLLNRPQIDASKLTEAGWEDAGEGIATVFTNTFSNEDGTVAINFTPILPDGSVLSPDELTSYAEGVIAGTRQDDLGLQIGSAFNGEDAIQQASNAAEEIHQLQEVYYTEGQLDPNSDEALDILEKIRQKKLDMQESDKAIAEYAEQQKDAYIEYYDKMMEAYSHRNDFFQMQSDYAQSYIDRLGTLNINVPDKAYDKLAEIQKMSNDGLKEQLAFANSELANFEANGIDKNDPRYIEKFKEALELEKQIYEGETKVYEYRQQIFDNKIDRFNQVIDRINDATQRLQNISDLLGDEDVATEDGEWTAEGLTRLGMAYQQMEYYKQSSDEIAKKMNDVERAYRRGEISEKKYYETMQELENQQWEAINSYEDEKDAIIELEEARIDMIEEGLNKEIEAYQELIDLKKEALDAERDLYDFRKDIQKQTKDIAALERRIASMSGSTDASTIAERTKLEAELREAREGLDDTYYNHGMDSMANALDDELEAYTTSAEDYIESLRESIKETDLLIEQTYQKVLQNADVILQTITTKSDEYGFYIDENLTRPWKSASITSSGFELSVMSHMDKIETRVKSSTSPLTADITAPWEQGKDGPKTFSEEAQRYMTQEVIGYANEHYKTQLKDILNYPWEQANGYTSWGEGIQKVLEQAKKDAEEAGRQIAASLNVEAPSYTGNGSGDGDGTKTNTSPYLKKPTVENPYSGQFSQKIKDLQWMLVYGFNLPVGKNARGNYKYTADGYWGTTTESSLKKAQKTVGANQSGKFDEQTRSKLSAYLTKQYNNSPDNDKYRKALSYLPKAAFAKGTMGTTNDQFAITDESWIGEEITLAAGKNGQLQYLKKGSAVMPADISANLVEWGKLNPSMMNLGGGANLNMISNAVNKPELNFSFDSLVHVDNCSQDTLKDLEKMVDTKINQFNKQLNQSLRKFK